MAKSHALSVHLSSIKVAGHMVDSWYLLPEWVQLLKISRGLLRHGPGIVVPQPSDVNLVILELCLTCFRLHG